MATVTINKSPAVFFDRDGVLIATTVRNGKPYAINSVEDLVTLPKIAELIQYYRLKGYKIVVVTNQPDVGNGATKKEEVEAMHQALQEKLPIDLIKVCYHSQSYGCDCRKPAIGMFLQAAAELNIDLSKSVMIGDRSGDIVAGKQAGCFTTFIDYGYNEPLRATPDLIVSSTQELFENTKTGVKN